MGTGNATLRIETGTKSAEERLTALEINFRELDREVEDQRLKLTSAIEGVQTNLDKALKEFREKHELRENEERALRRQSLKFQWAGIPLFLLGVIFSVVGNIVTC